MQTFIELNGLEFYAYHGVMEQEKKVGNTFMVDIRLEVNLAPAIASDKIEDTINYATVFALVKKEMESPSDLLEHIAGRILNTIRSHFPQVSKITVAVAKLNPPLGGVAKEAKVILST